MREENQDGTEFQSDEEFAEYDEVTANDELSSQEEFSDSDEFNDVSTDDDDDEDDDDDDDDDDEEDEEESDGQGSTSGVSGGIAGTAAVVAVIVLVLNAAISNLTAGFDLLTPLGTLFKFNITVSMIYEETEDQVVDFDNVDTGLVLVVSKDKIISTTSLATGVEGLEYSVSKIPRANEENKYDVVIKFSGQVEGLSENSRYSIRIIGDDNGKAVTYDSETIKTTARVSEIRGVNSVCTCTTDGKFRFTLDYDDENGFYSGFRYEFKNTDGEIVNSGDITDPKVEQIIENVDQLPGSSYVLVIYCESTAGADASAVNETSSFGDGVLTLTVNQGRITITEKVEI